VQLDTYPIQFRLSPATATTAISSCLVERNKNLLKKQFRAGITVLS